MMEVGVKRKFKIEKDMVDQLDEYSYEEKSKVCSHIKNTARRWINRRDDSKNGADGIKETQLLITLSKKMLRRR